MIVAISTRLQKTRKQCHITRLCVVIFFSQSIAICFFTLLMTVILGTDDCLSRQVTEQQYGTPIAPVYRERGDWKNYNL